MRCCSMEWLANGMRLLVMILPVITSVLEASTAELSTSKTTTTGTTPVPSSIVHPTKTTTTTTTTTTSYTTSSMPKPTPLPTPIVPRTMFVKYQNKSLILIIEDITVTYKDVDFYTSSLANLLIINTTLQEDEVSIKLQRFYLLHSQKAFYISFTFQKAEDQASWYIENFQHQNYSEDGDQRFQYRGIVYISAPVGQAYMCSVMNLHGTTANSGSDEDNSTITSELTFKGITAQPFTKNGRLSLERVVCGEEPPSEEGLDVRPIIGVVGGVCGVALLIALVVAAVVIFKSRRRGYDLLRNN